MGVHIGNGTLRGLQRAGHENKPQKASAKQFAASSPKITQTLQNNTNGRRIRRTPRVVNPWLGIPLSMLIHGVNRLRRPEATNPFPLCLTGLFCRQSGSPPLVLLSG